MYVTDKHAIIVLNICYLFYIRSGYTMIINLISHGNNLYPTKFTCKLPFNYSARVQQFISGPEWAASSSLPQIYVYKILSGLRSCTTQLNEASLVGNVKKSRMIFCEESVSTRLSILNIYHLEYYDCIMQFLRCLLYLENRSKSLGL